METKTDTKVKIDAKVWVEDTRVRIENDPAAGASEMLRLHRQIEVLEKNQRHTSLRLCVPDDLRNRNGELTKTPVVWQTDKSMGVRLCAEGLLFNGSKDIIQARLYKTSTGRVRVETLSDNYRRGAVHGKCDALGRAPTEADWKDEQGNNVRSDFNVRGSLPAAVIKFCQPEHLRQVLTDSGFAEMIPGSVIDEQAAPPAVAKAPAEEPIFEG